MEIFFTQVFRDNFFHADMHPGNIFVARETPRDPQYIAIDCGIVGSLTREDQDYLARNLLAFFHQDYYEVAALHIESGWVGEDTRANEFAAAVRTVCEPILEKPLKDISFGQVLLGLFQTARRFNMEVQPQLVLLQKTLLNIEGLGRQLYPDLDLWATAKPFLEQWMRERAGARGSGNLSSARPRSSPASYRNFPYWPTRRWPGPSAAISINAASPRPWMISANASGGRAAVIGACAGHIAGGRGPGLATTGRMGRRTALAGARRRPAGRLAVGLELITL